MKNPFFSILIPVYNVEEYLPRCLDAVLAQTFLDYEVILLNDGSKDGSLAVCETYAEKDARIRVTNRENKGLLATRLDQMEASKGAYFVFLDSDDYVAPNQLAFLHGMIEKHGCDLVTFGRHILEEDGSITRVESNVFDTERVFNADERHIPLAQLQQDNRLVSIWSKCVKRSVLLPLVPQLRSYEGIHMGEDSIFTAWIMTHFEKMVYTDEPLYFYRKNGIGMSSIKGFEEAMRCTVAIQTALESVDYHEKERVLRLFYSRQLYAKLSLLKSYLRQGITKAQYEECYRQIAKLRGAYKKHADKSYGFLYFLFKPCHYRLLKLVF